MLSFIGLLWNQRSNCYVGYVDFDDVNAELEILGKELENHMQQDSVQLQTPSINKQLATHVHQIIWHSITANFAYPIAYYGVKILSAHQLNNILFGLASKLECLNIHTIGSICDGASENRNRIHSFDWFATTWSIGDIVEFNEGRGVYSKAQITTIYLDQTKFGICLLEKSQNLVVDRHLLRPCFNLPQHWQVDDLCEYYSDTDQLWYSAKVIQIDGQNSLIYIKETASHIIRTCSFELMNHHLRPLYNEQLLFFHHQALNPITGELWYFMSDPTHVFKKLRNNLLKSYIGHKDGCRKIMYDGKPIIWNYIEDVYQHTTKNQTARITHLTKRHIFLTSWSKMRVDLAEQTLSLDVINAMKNIEHLCENSTATQVSFYN